MGMGKSGRESVKLFVRPHVTRSGDEVGVRADPFEEGDQEGGGLIEVFQIDYLVRGVHIAQG